jgi:hypothetical protein
LKTKSLTREKGSLYNENKIERNLINGISRAKKKVEGSGQMWCGAEEWGEGICPASISARRRASTALPSSNLHRQLENLILGHLQAILSKLEIAFKVGQKSEML